MFKDVNIDCYPAPSSANVSGKTSYIYTDSTGEQDSIAVTDDPTVLKSLLGTGVDMNKDYPNSNPKASGTSSGSPASLALAQAQTAHAAEPTGAATRNPVPGLAPDPAALRAEAPRRVLPVHQQLHSVKASTHRRRTPVWPKGKGRLADRCLRRLWLCWAC